jgi:predicted sulfurtransferase
MALEAVRAEMGILAYRDRTRKQTFRGAFFVHDVRLLFGNASVDGL